MAIRKSGNGLLGGRGLVRSRGTDDDPMGSMGNLMDVMLVFACGLIVALVMRYNVDIATYDPEVGQMQQIEQVPDAAERGVSTEDSRYEEMGTVYRDVETGKWYVIPDEESGDGGNE